MRGGDIGAMLIGDMRVSTGEQSIDRSLIGRALPARSTKPRTGAPSGSGSSIASAIAEQLGMSLSTLYTDEGRKVHAKPQAAAFLALAAMPKASLTESRTA